MNFPERRDLTCYEDEKFKFEGSGFCPRQWEISVRQKHCIIWSVVLSYLKSASLAVPGQFESRLKQLTGGEVNSELVKTGIENFNPFFNIHTCFYNETLRDIFTNFRERVNGGKRRKVPEAIQIITSMLNIQILIVDIDGKHLNLVEPESNSNSNVDLDDKNRNKIQIEDKSNANLGRVTLIVKEYTSTEEDGKPIRLKRFNFGLDEELCSELQKKALEIILETKELKAMAKEEILPLLDRREKDINIVISLLKKHLVEPLSSIYESWYTARKLSDAGFETDPRILDSEGFSAFYYALQSNNNNLVYILYRYAASNCYESLNTFRDPNPSIISTFSKIEEILKEDCRSSNNFETFGEAAEKARVTYQDLLRFNEFITQVSQGINAIREIEEGSGVEKAEKQKEIISIILEKYDAFYSVEHLDSQHISEEELIENYTKHKTYYDNLDFTVALLFFDNIFLLKSILKSPHKGFYSEIESSFLLSVITNKHFTGDVRNGIKKRDLGLDSNSNQLFIVPILERRNLREKIKHFNRILRETKVVETIDCIPTEEIDEMLSNYPTLKDEFLISRLDHYMKTALEKKPEGLKEKFVIQRALQVIGESIKCETKEAKSIKGELINDDVEEPSFIRLLLRKCLPFETIEILKKSRNTLSQLSSFQFPFKFEIEKDDDLFKSMKIEIQKAREAFEKVFDIQRVRLKEFLINQGLESIQKFQQDESIDSHPLVQPMENLREKLRKNITDLELEIFDQKGISEGLVVPNIGEFCRILTGHARKSVVTKIHGEIPPSVRSRMDANKKLLVDLDRGDILESDRFNDLFLKKRDIEGIKNEYKRYLESELESSEISKRVKECGAERSKATDMERNLKQNPMCHPKPEECATHSGESSRGQEKSEKESKEISKKRKSSLRLKIQKANLSNTLDLIFEKQKVSDSQLRVLHKEILFSDGAKSILDKLIQISNNPCGDNLVNLLNRIEHLYDISIKDNYDILYLWERVKSSRAKQYLVYKIVQLYFHESSFQASLEILLFDCFGIFKKNEGKKNKRKLKGKKTENQKSRSKAEDQKERNEENLEDQMNKGTVENEDQKKKRTEKEIDKGQKKKNSIKLKDDQKKKEREEENNEEQKKIRTENGNAGYQKKKTSEKENDEDQKEKTTGKDEQKKEQAEENSEDLRKRRTENGNTEDQKKKTTEKENDEDHKEKNEENYDQRKRKSEENNDDQEKKRTEKGNCEDQKKKRVEEENNDQENKRSDKGRDDDQSFWLKDSYLFNGIDVRNVLAHGDPLLESIGNILDPKDLPSELVKKMLQLIDDRNSIEALCDIWQKAKDSDEIPGDSSEWDELKEHIVCCANWQEYSKLLAEDPKYSEKYESLISFLRTPTVSNKRKSQPKNKNAKRQKHCNSESSEN